MTRKRIASALVTGLALILPTAGHSEIVDDFPEVVLFATHSIEIAQNSTVFSGDVVVNELTPQVELTIGNKATFPAGWEVRADSLGVGNFVNFNGALICNEGDALCVAGSLTAPVYDALPIFQTDPPPAGSPPVNVPQSGSETLMPGDYGDVTVGLEGTITFEGPGVFNIGSFTSGRKAQIQVTGAWAEIRVHGDMNTGLEDNININLGAPDASQVVFYVTGNASLGAKTTVNANFYVAGLLRLEANFTGTGAFLATDLVTIGQKGKFTLATFWDFPPQAVDDGPEATLEDTPVPIDVLANDSDAEGDPIFVNSVGPAGNGIVTCTGGTPFPCAVGDTLTYTPNADYFGQDSFTYEVCDVDTQINADNCAEATVTITVQAVNDPPSFTKGPDQSVDEDAGAHTVPGWATNISPGPANESDQTVSFLVSNDNNALFSAQPAVDGSGTLTYTPAADAFGSATVTVKAQDDGGTANGGVDTSPTQTFTITVASVNDPPVAVADVASMDEDGPAITIPVLANDSGGPANELQTVTLEAVAGSGNSHVEIVGSQVEYTPNPDFNGTDSFSYTVCDGGQDDDTATDGDDLCAGGTVTVTVQPVNDAPEADSQTVLTSGSGSVLITLTGSDVDGDTLDFSIVSGPDLAKGSLSGPTQVPPTSATVTYTPVSANDEANEFTFQVDDGNGGTATAIVSINPVETCTTDADCGQGFVCNTVEGVCEPAPLGQIDAKDALISDDTAYETETGEPVAITLVAAAPLPPDPNAIGDLAFTIVGGPTNGTLTAVVPIDPGTSPIRSASTTFTPTCTPPAEGICVGSFVFKACDAADLSNCDTATVEIVVADFEEPEPPVAEDISAAVETGSAEGVTFSLIATEGSPPDESPGDDGRQLLAGRSASASAAVDPLDNGGWSGAGPALRAAGPSRQAVQLETGGWTRFNWWDEVGAGGPPQASCSGPGALVEPATNLEGPFTFDVPAEGACLRVTDVLLTGDQFRILNAGQELATTPLVPLGGPSVGDDPSAAFSSPDYSHAELNLQQGAYSITLETIAGFWCGRGYLWLGEGPDDCGPEAPPLLLYTVATVPDASFGTLYDAAGQQVTAGTVLLDPSLTFVATATSGVNTQTTYTATSTATGLVSNLAEVTLAIVAEVISNDCLSDLDDCEDGRPDLQGAPAATTTTFAGPGEGFTVVVEGVGGTVASSPVELADGRILLGHSCSSSCTRKYPSGGQVSLFARPDGDDFEFVRWGGACWGTDPITTIRLTSETICTATFRKKDAD